MRTPTSVLLLVALPILAASIALGSSSHEAMSTIGMILGSADLLILAIFALASLFGRASQIPQQDHRARGHRIFKVDLRDRQPLDPSIPPREP